MPNTRTQEIVADDPYSCDLIIDVFDQMHNSTESLLEPTTWAAPTTPAVQGF